MSTAKGKPPVGLLNTTGQPKMKSDATGRLSVGTPAAIVLGAALIAAAILISNHWAVMPGMVLLDRWTGHLILCQVGSDSKFVCYP